mmetsp:Transcript_50676/g.105871  ORF Transcript_50676/g.105871 Transcript_50676/m.105871 type:complete len:178 (+) Transcript_50676:214-747(+)
MVRNGNLRLFGQYVCRLGQAWVLLQIQLGNIILGILRLLHRLVDDWKLLGIYECYHSAAVQGWKTRKRYTPHSVFLGPDHRGRDHWAHGARCFDRRTMRSVFRSEQRRCKAGGTRSGTGVTWYVHITAAASLDSPKFLIKELVGRLANQAGLPRSTGPSAPPAFCILKLGSVCATAT